MKKQYMRLQSAVVALILLVGVVAGCGGVTKDEPKADAGTTKVEETAKEQASEPVELRVEVFDRGIQGQAPVDNNYWTNWIQENFGKTNNINVKFVPVPRAEEINMLNIMMAAGEAPDLCYTYDYSVTLPNYISQGGILDLTAEVEKYGSNLKKFLGDEVLEFGKYDGKLYAIPGKRMLTGIVSSLIRKDWLDKLGLPVPKTTDEWYNAMKAFKEKDPGSLGDGTIPFGMSMMHITFGYFNLLYSFREDMSKEVLYTTPLWKQPGYQDGVRFLNKLYNEGLVSREFALDKDAKKLMADVSNGKVGFFISNVGAWLAPNPGVAPGLVKNVPGAQLIACDPFTNYEGKTPKFGNMPTGIFNFVPKSSKRAAEVVKYLDWMSQKDVLFTLQNGFEGEHYNIKDGLPADLTLEGEKKLGFSSNMDYVAVANGKNLGDLEKNIKAQSLTCPGFEQIFTDSYNQTIKDMVILQPFRKPITSQSKFGKVLAEKDLEMFTKLIMAKPSDFDSLYESLLQSYMSSGGEEIMKESQKVYAETMK